jgi:site-specific recombinase XerD
MRDQGQGVTSVEAEQLAFWPEDDMRKKRRLSLAAASQAANTTLAYESDWRQFSLWCEAQGVPTLPASDLSLAQYVADSALLRRVSTIRRHVAAIASRHRAAGLVDPSKSETVRQVLRGARRKDTAVSARKRAVAVPDVVRMVRVVRKGLDAPRALRDAAILLLGFAGGFRRSELACLQISDIAFQPRKGIVVELRRSKTDQVGDGRPVPIRFAKTRQDMCPVAAVRQWLKARGPEQGPLFVRVGPSPGNVTDEPLSGQAIGEVVKRAARLAGLDPRDYAGHSLRAGLVTAAAAGGASDSAIMSTTGHRSVTTLTRYLRHASPFAGGVSVL